MWLLEASTKQAIERAQHAGIAPSAEFQASLSARSQVDTSRVMSVAGGTAEINVTGTLTNTPDFFAMLFGGGNTTYPDIVAALAEADSSPTVNKAVLRIDSPGGTVAGMFDAMAAIEAFSKPLEARVGNLAASAAYALASQADTITAENRAARFGSVGIVARIGIDEQSVTLTSTPAPKKAPDATTAEGKAMIVEELDAMHSLFVEGIAAGRGTTPEKINSDFGSGAVLLADEALKRGMIDAVATKSPKPTAVGGNHQEASNMDLKELKASHADVYAAAVEEGVAQERDRVTAHLTMGKASGDTATAYKAIEEGAGMTATLQAAYMSAAMNKSDITARVEDDVAASAADLAAAGQQGDSVADAVEQLLGLGA